MKASESHHGHSRKRRVNKMKGQVMMNRKRIQPGPGQESVWDYPRPPRLEDSPKHLQVIFNDAVIADTRRAKRVLETSHPPVYYVPPEDIKMEHLTSSTWKSWCEWKGQAAYYNISVGDRQAENAAWYYPRPEPSFESLKGYVAFYPSLMTSDIVGPFKGEPGTRWW
jgi:uncharacterized protein (DUF427 family)